MSKIAHRQVSTAQNIQDTPDLASKPMSEVQADTLLRECQVFTTYLIGQQPNRYIIRKYSDGCDVSDVLRDPEPNSFDAFLLRVARTHSFASRLVDTYTCVFQKGSIFRKRLVLLLAIVESCAPFYSHVDVPDSTGKLSLLIGLFHRGAAFALFLLLSTVLLFPIQLVFAVLTRFSFLPKVARQAG
jgi:hypothetical protein